MPTNTEIPGTARTGAHVRENDDAVGGEPTASGVQTRATGGDDADRPGHSTKPRPNGAPLPTPTAIKRAINPADFYARELEHAPALKANGNGWSQNFPCPFHDDSNGSFGVHIKTGAFRCFGCDAQGGSVIDFAMQRDGLSLEEARAALAERYGIAHEKAPTEPRPRAAKPASPAPTATPGPLVPIPAEALATRPAKAGKLGVPSATWIYTDPDGRPLAFVLRFERPDGSKEFRPQTWTAADGWQWKAPPEPRPLYHLDQLAARPDAPVLFAEGEKAADAAALLLPEMVATTTAHGAQSPQKSDFGPLAGRHVRIWRDHDEPGAQYARTVGELAQAAGAASVEVLDLASLAVDPGTGEPRELPPKWDAADAAVDGWTTEALAREARWTTTYQRLQGLQPVTARLAV